MGAITFHEANDKRLNITVQVNDMKIHEYHRSNGITKIRFRNTVNSNKSN